MSLFGFGFPINTISEILDQYYRYARLACYPCVCSIALSAVGKHEKTSKLKYWVIASSRNVCLWKVLQSSNFRLTMTFFPMKCDRIRFVPFSSLKEITRRVLWAVRSNQSDTLIGAACDQWWILAGNVLANIQVSVGWLYALKRIPTSVKLKKRRLLLETCKAFCIFAKLSFRAFGWRGY